MNLLRDDLLDVWLGDLELAVHGVLPVYRGKECVLLDLVGAAFTRPESLIGVPVQKGDEHVAGVLGQVVRQLQGPVLDVRIQLFLIV